MILSLNHKSSRMIKLLFLYLLLIFFYNYFLLMCKLLYVIAA